MSNALRVRFFLTGAHAGKTIKLGKYSFVNGSVVVEGQAEQIALHARSLERNWSVYPEGDPRLKPAEKEQEHGGSDLSPGTPGRDGTPDVSGGDGLGGSEPPAGDEADVGHVDAGPVAGGAELPTDGDGQAPSVIEAKDPELKDEPKAEVNEKLKRAVFALDPKEDTHWTGTGLPAMVAVERLYGSAAVTRADVEAVAPGYLRPKA